jgi:hypothetical protein
MVWSGPPNEQVLRPSADGRNRLHANCRRLVGSLHLLLKFNLNRFKPPRKKRSSPGLSN